MENKDLGQQYLPSSPCLTRL